MRRESQNAIRFLQGVAGLGIIGLLASCAPEAPVSALDAAYAAMGGDNLKSISMNAHWAQWDPGESYSVADPLTPDDGMSDLVQTRDLENGLTRNEWVRPKPDDGTLRMFTEIVTPKAGLVIGNDATNGRLPKRTDTSVDPPVHTMSGPRLTATLRELERTDIVREMHMHPDQVMDVTPPGGGPNAIPTYHYLSAYGAYTVTFDPMTKLPSHVTTRDWDALFGDSDYDAAFSDWRDVNGVQVPFRIDYTLSGMKIAEVTYSEVTINPMLDPANFAIPQDRLANAEAPAPANETPYQWIIRRQFTGFYVDSSAYYTDEGDKLELTDIAQNVSQLTGGSHNSLVVATNDYLVVVDAPNDDGQSKILMDLAAQKYPGKPIRYLVLTHHHVDHAGGMRAFAAAGATVVVGPGDGEKFREWLGASHAMDFNGPTGNIPVNVVEVSDKWSVNDAGRVVEAYPIANPHAADMLIAYLPQLRLGWVTDIWNPGAPVANANPAEIALVDGVTKAKLRPLRFAGGHGSVANYSVLTQAVQKAKTAKR